jgi:hypothetical protein
MKQTISIVFILFGLLSAGFSQEIIIESRVDGKNFSWYSETSGNWADSVAKSLADNCSPDSVGSRFAIVDGGPVDAQARFTPVLPKEGKYDIYVTWGRSGNAFNVKHIINTGTKEEVKYLDQAGWGGTLAVNAYIWLHLGTYDLPAGNKAYVAVDASEVKGKPSEENSARVYVDAVKFVPYDPSAQPTATPASQIPASQTSSTFTPFTKESSPFAASPSTTSQVPSSSTMPASLELPFVPLGGTSPQSATVSPFSQPGTQGTPSPFRQPVTTSSQATPLPFSQPGATSSQATPSPFTQPGATSSQATPSPFAQPGAPFSQPGSSLPPLQSTASLQWYTSYNEAIQAGAANNKSIMLFFRSALGKSSNIMENDVLNNAQVKTKLLQSFICCKLDITQSRPVCDYYGIFKAPVLVFLDSRGYSRARIDNLLDPEELAREMEKYK